MRCQDAQKSIVLAQYGELSDDLLLPLEQHLNTCEDCRREWNAHLALHETLALDPVIDALSRLLGKETVRPFSQSAGRLAHEAGRGA